MGLQPLRAVDLVFPEAETPQIEIESWSNATRLLQIRGFCRSGLISFDHTTNGDRSRKSEVFNIPDWPVFLQVSPSTAPVRRGECYVRLTLRAAGFPVGRLSAGYLTDSKTITWPPGVFEGFTEGPGLIRRVTGTDPAAGNEISETVPTNARWRLLAMRIRLATTLPAATRRVHLILDDGVHIFAKIKCYQTQAENVTRSYTFISGLGYEDTSAVGEAMATLPVVILLDQGYRIRTATDNLGADDDYSAPILLVEEWLEE